MKEKMNLEKIKAFSFDVDGVLTGGGILCNSNGDFLRYFDAKDGFGMRMASMHGYGLAIITGGWSETITTRVKASGVKEEDIYLKSRNKVKDFIDYCNRHGYSPDEVMYIGDDLPDIPLVKYCGLGVCPSDAVPEMREAADFVSEFPGGKGCVRDAIRMVMQAQGTWTFDAEEYENKF